MRELAAVWHDKAAGEAGLAGLHDLAGEGVPLHGAQVLPAAVSAAAMAVAPPPAVELQQLRFAHPGEAPVFDGFDLKVLAGEHVALLGASGAGKTTLLSLLAGLLPASGGDIRIGGVRLTDSTVNTLRQRMAWMGQRPHVFAASVSQNVTLGRVGANAAQVTQALHLADLAAVAQAQPAVMLSDGGRGLSGGEAVRLATARVALHPHADLLLVDEPTAHRQRNGGARHGCLAGTGERQDDDRRHTRPRAGRPAAAHGTGRCPSPGTGAAGMKNSLIRNPVLRQLLLAQPGKLIGGALLAALTAVSGMALLGLSGWFITATSIAGLHASTAILFDVFGPSAGIRLLAIGRTGSRYAERLVTHDATFAALASIRVRLFRGWSRPEAASRLLRQPAKLLFRLTADIDALESLYLRLLVPAFTALCAALLAGVALGVMQWQLGLGLAAWLLAAGGGISWIVAQRARRPAIVRSRAIEKIAFGHHRLVAGQTDW